MVILQSNYATIADSRVNTAGLENKNPLNNQMYPADEQFSVPKPRFPRSPPLDTIRMM